MHPQPPLMLHLTALGAFAILEGRGSVTGGRALPPGCWFSCALLRRGPRPWWPDLCMCLPPARLALPIGLFPAFGADAPSAAWVLPLDVIPALLPCVALHVCLLRLVVLPARSQRRGPPQLRELLHFGMAVRAMSMRSSACWWSSCPEASASRPAPAIARSEAAMVRFAASMWLLAFLASSAMAFWAWGQFCCGLHSYFLHWLLCLKYVGAYISPVVLQRP